MVSTAVPQAWSKGHTRGGAARRWRQAAAKRPLAPQLECSCPGKAISGYDLLNLLCPGACGSCILALQLGMLHDRRPTPGSTAHSSMVAPGAVRITVVKRSKALDDTILGALGGWGSLRPGFQPAKGFCPGASAKPSTPQNNSLPTDSQLVGLRQCPTRGLSSDAKVRCRAAGTATPGGRRGRKNGALINQWCHCRPGYAPALPPSFPS